MGSTAATSTTGNEPSAKRKVGRPTDKTPKLCALICKRIAEGESLRNICREDGMPGLSTVFLWLGQDPVFMEQYARAREEQADTYADEIVAIADEPPEVVHDEKNGTTIVLLDSTAIARQRLRIDARKWVASKLKPKKYGDKLEQEISGPNGGPIRTENDTKISPSDAYLRMIGK